MKKLLSYILVLTLSSLSAMDEKPQPVSSSNISDLCNQLSKSCPELRNNIALKGTQSEWWYPAQKKSYKKNSITLAQFSPSGKKVAALTMSGRMFLYSTENGELQASRLTPLTPTNAIKFNIEETKLFGFGLAASRYCWDTLQNNIMNVVIGLGSDSHAIQCNESVTKAILNGNKRALLVDIATGKSEGVLWNIVNDDLYQNVACAGFSANTNCVHVFHNKRLINKEFDSEKIQSKPIVPDEAYYAMYSNAKNSLLYFCTDGKVKVLDVETEKIREIKGFDWREEEKRTLESERYPFLVDDGRKLILIAYDESGEGQFKDHWGFIDIYSLDSCDLVMTIFLDSRVRDWCLKKNRLLLRYDHQIQLWDIEQNCLIGTFCSNKFFTAMDMNEQCNKIILADDEAVMWNSYQPTWEQFLLKQRVIWWWKTKRRPHNFNSPEEWLADVAKTFSLSRWDLIKPWKSLAPEGCNQRPITMPNGKEKMFSQLQVAIWRTVQNRIKRSQQYSDYMPSQVQ